MVSPHSCCPNGVYPRVCGGTRYAHIQDLRRQGLSPRVRGNLKQQPPDKQDAGSIPACAGEPRSLHACTERDTVYPRVCGGTRTRLPRVIPDHGLSPRVRGNHMRRYAAPTYCRSIPACAGEPPGRMMEPDLAKVYPRVCGGTGLGVSPILAITRSIPACAGEPCVSLLTSISAAVYPRVCGGTGASQRPPPG